MITTPKIIHTTPMTHNMTHNIIYFTKIAPNIKKGIAITNKRKINGLNT